MANDDQSSIAALTCAFTDFRRRPVTPPSLSHGGSAGSNPVGGTSPQSGPDPRQRWGGPLRHFQRLRAASATSDPGGGPDPAGAGHRAGVVREGFSRDGVARSGLTRTEQCDDEGCVAAVTVPAVRLDPVRLQDVDVDTGRLQSRRFEQDVSIVSGEDRVSYVATGAVLFESESAVLKPAAEQSLRRILDAIDPGISTRLLVEGHTDDRGSAAYGLGLSRQRAVTVAQWLIREGARRSNVTTDGLGESAPAVPNTSDANRARNRRVVITVLS